MEGGANSNTCGHTKASAIVFFGFSCSTSEEQAVRKRVREFMEKEVTPIMTEKAEFPFYIIPKLGALGVVRGSIKGYGCPGLSITANAIATAEISRVDGSCGTFNLVHTYLGMFSIGKMSLAWRRFHPKTD
ncbi:hypothetical protein Bca4012_044894 [Brassica carinata]